MSDEARRFPIGRFRWPEIITAEDRRRWIETIASQPARLREAASGLSEAQLDMPYREGGWTARQVIHHVPDSHLNSYIRFKLALTEDSPVIKPYDEAAWAKLADTDGTPVESSLQLLESLHERWVALLRSLDDAGWKREFRHPDMGPISLERNLALYAWHGDHHIGHVKLIRVHSQV